MYVHLLGTVELSARGEPLSIGSRKVRTLLACLAIDPERPVSPDTLAERLWDGEPPPSAAGTLQVYISRLRSALRKANETAGSADGPPVEIVSRSGTYALRAETDQVDWQLFHRLAVQARSLVEVGDDRGALAALDRASDIWQGEPLAGLPGLWAAQMRSLMKGRRFAASVTRCEIELRFGRYADLVPDLAELADEQPWNEQVAAQLMTALYGCGRIAEALAAYRRIRRRLRDDLATEPDETLNRLHERMLRRELLDHTVPPQRTVISAPPSAPAPSRRPTTLPPAPELVGRERELDLLVAAARGEWPMSPNARPASLPVVAVSGMPGCGKTALALAAAHRLHESFEDGAVLLRLGAHSGEQEDRGPESAATALLRQFGVPSSEIPVEPDKLLAHCRELLAQRHAVVVLDDAAGPDQIGPLLPAAPTSFVLITSRRRMAELPTVSTIPLNALTPQAATDMFTRLVGPARTTDPARVTDITRLCARHPLALHIAAGRFRGRPSWTLDHLAERLSRRNGRLDELRDSHGGIDRSFAMSYQALDAGHQLALHRLSLHPGDGFGAYLGAALIGCPPDRAERLIEDLLAVHLIDERTPDRFGFHDLIREFAQETSLRIDPEHARSGAFRRLVSVAIATVDRADRLINPHQFRLPVPAELLAPAARDFPHLPDWLGPDEARTWLATEMPALLAVEHTLRANGRPAPAAWLAHLLTPHLEAAGLWHEALRVHREAARHWRSAAHPQNEVHALIGLSMIQLRVSQYAEAIAGAEQALALARAAGDRTAQAEALGRLGEVHWERGEFARAMELQHEVLQLRRSTEDRWGLARALNNTGLLAARTGDHKTSRKSFSEALSIFEELDDLKGQLNTLNNIGGLLLEIGEKESARRTFTRLSRHEAVAQDSMAMAIVRLNLAQTVHLPEESVEATALLDSAIQTFRRTGSPKHEIDATNVLGAVQLAAGRPGSAAELFRRSLTLSRQIGAVDEAATALAGLGQAERLLYAPPAPRAHREETAVRPMAEFHRTGTNPAKPGPE